MTLTGQDLVFFGPFDVKVGKAPWRNQMRANIFVSFFTNNKLWLEVVCKISYTLNKYVPNERLTLFGKLDTHY